MLRNFSKKIIFTVLLGLSFNVFNVNAGPEDQMIQMMRLLQAANEIKSEDIMRTAQSVYVFASDMADYAGNAFDYLGSLMSRKSSESTEQSRGDAESSDRTTRMSDNSRRAPDRLKESTERLLNAARDGDIKAQHMLAFCYHISKDIEHDPEKAFEWWYKAAENGSADAQFYLGLCYEDGLGVENNLEKALEWYRKAAAQRYAPAIQKLNTTVFRNLAEAQEKIDQVNRRYVNRENGRSVVEIVY